MNSSAPSGKSTPVSSLPLKEHLYIREFDPQGADSLAKIARLIRPHTQVLDLGTGPGVLGKYLSTALGCVVDGVEMSGDQARLAKPFYRYLRIADLETAQLAALFPDQGAGSETEYSIDTSSTDPKKDTHHRYDYIVCADVLEHLKNPGAVASQLPALLKPQGRVLLSIPNIAHAGVIAELLAGEFRYRPEGLLDSTHLRFFTRKSLLEFLNCHGLVPLSVEGIPCDIRASEFRGYYVETLPPAIYRLLQAYPDALTYQFIVEARPGAQAAKKLAADPVVPEFHFACRLYWRLGTAGYQEENSSYVLGCIGKEHQRIRFSIPPLPEIPTGIRIAPAERPGFMQIHQIALYDKERQNIWRWPGDIAHLPAVNTYQMEFSHSWSAPLGVNAVLMGKDPSFELSLEESVLASLQAGGGLELQISWPLSADFMALTQRLEQKDRELQAQEELLREKDRLLVHRGRQLEEKERLLEASHQDLQGLHEKLAEQQRELTAHEQQLAESNALANYLKARLAHQESWRGWMRRPFRPLKRWHLKRFEARTAHSPCIDIIIPVYNAYEYLRDCLERLRLCTQEPYRLVLIDDASTDSRIQTLFEELEAAGDEDILLLRNEYNQGFVATANRGMSLGANDVVLLNSDTLVTRNWLEKLKRCAASDPKIGTITPFTNNGEICSFPEFCRENPLPDDPELLNQALDHLDLAIYPDIPTGVGFCLYIRRALIHQVGLFDEDAFGRGYGEENDLCLRAAQAGFRNVLCSDAYVAHVGGCSFGQEKSAIGEKQMAVLLNKHPTYLEQVDRFIKQDPLKPLRQLIQGQLEKAVPSRKPAILHVMHGHGGPAVSQGRGGGIGTYIENLTARLAGEFRHYGLIALEREWTLQELSPGEENQSYRFQRQDNETWPAFLEGICAWLDVRLCHIHQIADCRDGLLEAFAGVRIPYGVSIHDFLLACPTVNLLDGKARYCHAVTNTDQCQQCLDDQLSFAHIDIGKWRRRHGDFLAKAAFVLAPSAWARRTFNKYFPGVPVTLIPNFQQPPLFGQRGGNIRGFLLPQDSIKSIGVLGAIGPVKGARQLEQLVERTRERQLPLRWVVIGYTDRQGDPPVPYQSEDQIVTLHGPYRQADLPALLDHYAISLVVFPSAGPETFSYTLSEAWAAGRPVLVPPIGALEERVADIGAGWIMEDWQDMDKILDQVMALVYPEAAESLLLIQECVEQANRQQADQSCSSSLLIAEAYRRSFASFSPSELRDLSSWRIYEAACQGRDGD
ncbi:Glycosyl transferase, family 2 [Nitrosococcus oceani ATCC 19707]|uniref:Glycosyl transferase, family 2 n=2 Tax=Nitrosococcus oceani TaxID=1229 RepID=Q3J958_NITOC|nr:methyltransferase domain-containing protein [Nitrosococcus oceani]ABA58638.1 Glycosyl transferase, family 2 [Nitrosococcus oceani ATCC 19707]EDZ66854.1 Methyltransferase domain family [Nitrosococcus oceani AFC27]KFI18938.1 glycosyl transferase [Nitrosococcus oceani C-27]GEM19758.1 glycosyl transferase [Nitrosococcus oceani]